MNELQDRIKKHKRYDENPVAWVKDGWRHAMGRYLWLMWAIITLMLIVAHVYGVIDVSNHQPASTMDMTFSVLLVLPLVAQYHFRLFNDDELVQLLNQKTNGVISMFAPYVFTALLFIVLGILSFITPTPSGNVSLILLLLELLGGFALFNVFYTVINDMYYIIIKKDMAKAIDRINNQEPRTVVVPEEPEV